MTPFAYPFASSSRSHHSRSPHGITAVAPPTLWLTWSAL